MGVWGAYTQEFVFARTKYFLTGEFSMLTGILLCMFYV